MTSSNIKRTVLNHGILTGIWIIGPDLLVNDTLYASDKALDVREKSAIKSAFMQSLAAEFKGKADGPYADQAPVVVPADGRFEAEKKTVLNFVENVNALMANEPFINTVDSSIKLRLAQFHELMRLRPSNPSLQAESFSRIGSKVEELGINAMTRDYPEHPNTPLTQIENDKLVDMVRTTLESLEKKGSGCAYAICKPHLIEDMAEHLKWTTDKKSIAAYAIIMGARDIRGIAPEAVQQALVDLKLDFGNPASLSEVLENAGAKVSRRSTGGQQVA